MGYFYNPPPDQPKNPEEPSRSEPNDPPEEPDQIKTLNVDQPESTKEKIPQSIFHETSSLHSTRRGLSTWLTALLSSFIGGLMVLVVVFALALTGVISIPSLTGKDALLPEESGPNKEASVKVTTDITEAAKKVRPAVVGIRNIRHSSDPFNPGSVEAGTGSGIIFYKKDGRARVVTNNHVIEGANTIVVVLPKGNGNKQVRAKVMGTDPPTDLAVLEIPAEGIKTIASFGDSDKLTPGEPAIAIGNPLGLTFSQSVTVGVISSQKRTLQVTSDTSMDFIQTDATINPGNSGGALINVAGQVIGINSLKITQQGVEGLGFAIPSNDAKPIINDLVEVGRVIRPYIGVQEWVNLESVAQEYWQTELQLPDNVSEGVVVLKIQPGSPAEEAGLEFGDVIVAIDGQPIPTGSELRRHLWKKNKVGDSIEITYYSGGSKKKGRATLVKSPK